MKQSLVFDHPGVGQEFPEIDANAARIGGVGGAEVDQENADALRPEVGRSLGSLDGNDRAHDIDGFARRVILVKITAVSILSPARA
jgi:hypothetical protein